ncbi:MAG: phosphoribosylglycinamide formyltransferase [Candidatus Cloacimonetes bacterium]|nr:phosphoribosylglycinamide formyltransferase [Candidatus Cloacimonadota bacterium]
MKNNFSTSKVLENNKNLQAVGKSIIFHPLNIVFLTSGKSRGSNFESIVKYIYKNKLPISMKFLIVTRPDAPIIQRAENNNVKWILLSDKNNFEQDLLGLLSQYNVHLVVLAGFMRKLSPNFLNKFKGKIINIHPALLPKYGGKGMYGMRVHQAVFENNEKFSGVTVHFVNEEYDAGEIIFQEKIPIDHLKSAEEIAHEVLKIEHEIYPKVIEKLAYQFFSDLID